MDAALNKLYFYIACSALL